MAHFAEIDNSNIVIRVVVIDDAHEADGTAWCKDFFGGGNWLQTSYNGTIRKNYAGIGYTYESGLDAFYSPQPYPSWCLDDAAQWQPPTPEPQDDFFYIWDEINLVWTLVN